MTSSHDSENHSYQIRDQLGYTIYALQSIVTQGRRVLHDHNRNRAEKLSRNNPFITNTRMDEMFFLTALNQANRWLNDLEKYLPKFESTFSEFNKISGGDDGKKVRHKREHAEEIYGSKQKNRNVPSGNPLFNVSTDSGLEIQMSSSVTYVRGDRIVLGGRVDVRATMEAAAALVETLRPVQLHYWTSTTKRSRDKIAQFLAPEDLMSH